ncbi:hypothetical protein SUGI_1069640 [Cryptomeria japonica]|nr:hypothetical protein SUGI_1069640 [Cryptomeria japonica]
MGYKVFNKSSFIERINRQYLNHSVINNIDAMIDWIRYDPITRLPVIESEPPKISPWTRKAVRSTYKAFIKRGAVVFTRDNCRKPITWHFYRKFTEGQTLKWKIQASIWVTYWPNAIDIRYFETRCHHFCQLVDLTLQQSSS